MFQPSFYDELDPSYCRALQKLESDISQKRPFFYMFNEPLLFKFFTNFLMPEKLWTSIWNSDLNKRKEGLHNLAVYQLSSCTNGADELRMNGYIVPKRKVMSKVVSHRESSIAIYLKDTEDLCYPHNLLEFYLYCYEFHASSHLPPKIIKRNFEMRKLYEKIKFVEENEEEWINAMKEADDIEFVKHNVEEKLGKDLTNKKLWILYIKYLQEYDKQELLQTYSKYCRFFTDDISMKEEYKKAAEKYGKPTVPWKNAFDFEVFDESLLNVKYAERPESSARWTNENIPRHIPPPFEFNNNGIICQIFPFHPNLINYIVKNAKANVLQKLNFSCKYFFDQYRIPVCYHLDILNAGPTWALFKYKKESLRIRSDTITEVKLDNFYISTKLYYSHSKMSLRNLMPKLYKCDAKIIEICLQKLTFNELKFFIDHGNVIDLCLSSCEITGGENNAPVFLEDILAFTPKLQYLRVRPANCSKYTAYKLYQLPFENKFMTIKIDCGTNYLLEPRAFAEFLKKNASVNCKIITNFVIDFENQIIVHHFDAVVSGAIFEHWEGNHKPHFSIMGF